MNDPVNIFLYILHSDGLFTVLHSLKKKKKRYLSVRSCFQSCFCTKRKKKMLMNFVKLPLLFFVSHYVVSPPGWSKIGCDRFLSYCITLFSPLKNDF